MACNRIVGIHYCLSTVLSNEAPNERFISYRVPKLSIPYLIYLQQNNQHFKQQIVIITLFSSYIFSYTDYSPLLLQKGDLSCILKLENTFHNIISLFMMLFRQLGKF